MGLFLRPSVSVNRFQGGYKSNADYTDLKDTETNDAQNCEYGTDGDIVERFGSLRLYNTSLKSDGGSVGRPVTGHFYFEKLSQTASTFNVVASGDSLFNYTSATANAIRTGLTDSSQAAWSFVQIADPRSASDDIMMGTNGIDPIQVWNGSATAVVLSSFTSATQVPIAKYLLENERQIYAFNIVDSTDVDSPVLVRFTEFGSDGAPDPHRFTGFFYVGGSDPYGELRGGDLLNGQIIFYRERAIYKFNPTFGANDLFPVTTDIGLLAPKSLIDVGGLHIFLSDRGVYTYDGNTLSHVSEDVDRDLLTNSNRNRLQDAVAEFDHEKNQYKLYYPSQGSDRNDVALTLDLRPTMGFWQPPVTGREVSTISKFKDSNNQLRILYGDYFGYMYEDGIGTADGIETGYFGSVSTAVNSTSRSFVTVSAANFPTQGDGLSGLRFLITDGDSVNSSFTITENTSETLTLDGTFSVLPTDSSTFSIAAIDSYWKSKDYSFGNHDIRKLFRHVRLRTAEKGSYPLTMHYIIDFRTIAQANLSSLSLYENGFVWNVSAWNQVRWGGVPTIRKKVSLRSTSNQPSNGTHMALRFSNRFPNQDWSISGYDIEINAIGKE